MDESCTAGQTTDDNMAYASFMLHTYGYKHTHYVTIITFSLQQWLQKHALMLHYTYTAGLVVYSVWFSQYTVIISLKKRKRGCLSNWNTLCPLWGMNWTTWGPNTSHFIFIITNECAINLLKPTGHVMHQQFNIQQLYVLPRLYLCVLCLSENKQRLVPLTA